MESEDGYMALNLQSRRVASGTAAGAQKRDGPGLPCWYRITLWLGGFVIMILGVAVAILALHLKTEKGETGVNAGRCNACLDGFQAFLRHSLCNQYQSKPSVNSTCKVCPVRWQLHRDKCYWQSEVTKTWAGSQHNCSAMDSQLLVIQDKEEMDFIKNITNSSKFWIGLSLLKSEKKWMWVTGLQLDQSLFPEPKYEEGNYCGKIKSEFVAEACNIELRWICQKDSLLL